VNPLKIKIQKTIASANIKAFFDFQIPI